LDELPNDNVEEYRKWGHTLKEQAEKLDAVIREMISNISTKANI
jgi:hypothetical protein